MSNLLFFQAFVDFKSKLTLEQLCKLFSESFFFGVDFIGGDEGIWDEVPAVRLSKDFFGLRIVLGGYDGVYTLEIETFDFNWDLLNEEDKKSAVVDISANVRQLFTNITEIQLVDKHD